MRKEMDREEKEADAMGSTWGNALKISIFGESHGEGIGTVLDGFPAGLQVDMEALLAEMARRAPGQSKFTTSRKEPDIPEILSGICDGHTTGAPICGVIRNTNQRSGDYENLRIQPRPSHSDMTGAQRYHGCNDIRGGGHFSGRLTAPLVFAGALCRQWLRTQGVEIGTHIAQIGSICDATMEYTHLQSETLCQLQQMRTPVLDEQAGACMMEEVDKARMDGDSVGGILECGVTGLKPGLGSPMLQSVESRIASILYGVPAVKGVEFGDGFALASQRGSAVNDCYEKVDSVVRTRTNHNGGILGGISTGMPLIVRVAIKPTPSISCPQQTLNTVTGKVEELVIRGRHDPCIALRAPVVIEAAVAVALTDLYLEAMGYGLA